MKLGAMVFLVRRLESVIAEIRNAMTHSDSVSVNILRKHAHDLENIREVIMNDEVEAVIDIEYLLTKSSACLAECIQPTYMDKPPVLPPPTPPTSDLPQTPPNVTGCHIIFYLDSTGSMRSYYSDMLGKDLKRLGNYIEAECATNSISGTFSLIWFGDKSAGSPYVVAKNQANLTELKSSLGSSPVLPSGNDLPESGMWVINESIDNVMKSGVENVLIYATDAATKPNEDNVTPDSVKILLDSKGINTRFAIIPTKKEPDIKYMFTDIRNISDKKNSYNLNPWGYTALHI